MLYTDDQSGFYGADALMAAIGQSENKFTVMQLAAYAATLANQGTRYAATFLQRVVSADYSELLLENEPEVVSELEISDEAMSAIIEGMTLCATGYRRRHRPQHLCRLPHHGLRQNRYC